MNIAIGEVVRKLRKHRGMTLKDLSGTTGVSISHLSLIERGQRDPSLGNLNAIAEAFGLPASVLALLSIRPQACPGEPVEARDELVATLLKVVRDTLSEDERYPRSL